jgi:hypothetical protein
MKKELIYWITFFFLLYIVSFGEEKGGYTGFFTGLLMGILSTGFTELLINSKPKL